MTIALPARTEARRVSLDLSQPVMIVFAALLCVLVILPVSWLVVYSVSDRSGAFTLANFRQLFTDPVFVRSATRVWFVPGSRYYVLGFRLAQDE